MKPVCGDEGWGCQEASGGQQGCAGRAASGEGKRCARRLFLQPHSLQPRAPELGREKGSCPPAPSPAASSPLPARRKRTRPHHEAHPRQETVPQAKMGNSPPRQLPPPPVLLFSSNPQAAGSEEPAWPGSWHSHAPRWRGGDRARRLRAHSLQPSRGGCQNARGISALHRLRGPKTPLYSPQRWALPRPHCTSSLPCRKRGNLDSPSARGCMKKVQLRPSTGTAARSV